MVQYPRTKRITRPRLDLEVANSFKVWAAVFCLDLEMDRILDLRISCFEFRLDTGKLAIDRAVLFWFKIFMCFRKYYGTASKNKSRFNSWTWAGGAEALRLSPQDRHKGLSFSPVTATCGLRPAASAFSLWCCIPPAAFGCVCGLCDLQFLCLLLRQGIGQ